VISIFYDGYFETGGWTYTSRRVDGCDQVIGKGTKFCSVRHVASVRHMFILTRDD
jgi:hypothetical protein